MIKLCTQTAVCRKGRHQYTISQLTTVERCIFWTVCPAVTEQRAVIRLLEMKLNIIYFIFYAKHW